MNSLMARRELFKRTYPRLPPHEQTREYLQSKETVQLYNKYGFGVDRSRCAPELELSTVRGALEKISDTLTEKREFFKKESQRLDTKWQELEEKEVKLKTSFLLMNAFINSNKHKRERALETKKYDSQLSQQRSTQIENTRRELKSLDMAKAELDGDLSKHILYKYFLDKVVASAPGEFKNTDDVVRRFESLKETGLDLAQRQNANLNNLEASKSETVKMIEEYRLKILGLQNTIAVMTAQHQMALKKSLNWERVVWQIKQEATDRLREIFEVKQACKNIYHLMCRRKNTTPKIDENDFEGQLVYIKKTLRQLRSIREEVRMEKSRKITSMKVEKSKGS